MSLLDSLISYWKFDEPSGNAIDSHGSNALTDNGSVGTQSPGLIVDCRSFNGINQYFDLADNADLSTGDISFTFSAWVRADSFPTNPNVLSKANADGSVEEYRIDWFSNRFRFAIKDSAGNYQVAEANNLGAPATLTWYFIVAWHDAANDTVNIQVNNGMVDSVATAGLGPVDTAAAFSIGRLSANYWHGLSDEVGFWKRVLTSQERTDLYNAGAGLSYDSFGGVVPLAPATVIVETRAAENEICWTPSSGATSHTVERSSTEGGTYTTLGTVNSTDPPFLVDSSPISPAWYRVFATNAEGDGDPSSAVEAPAVLDHGLDGSTVDTDRPTTRHNLLTDGTDYVAAVPGNLTFAALGTEDRILSGGAFSPISKVDETFASGLGALSLSVAGSGTAGVSGGSLTYTGSNTTAVYQAAGVHYRGPWLSTGANVESCTGRIRVGLGADKDNGVFAEYDSSTDEVAVVGYASGTPTTLVTAVSLGSSGAFLFALECVNACFNIWVDTGAGETVLTGAQVVDESTWDLRYRASDFDAWVPLIVLESAGTLNVNISRYRATIWNGAGYQREGDTVRHADGSNYRNGVGNDTYWILWDRCTLVTGSNFGTPVGAQLMSYSWSGNSFGDVTASFSATYPGGEVAVVQDLGVTFDPDLNGFHVWFCDWGLEFRPAESYVITLYYAFYDGDITQGGEVHFDSPTAVTLPAAINLRRSPLYAPNGIRHDDRWYLLGTTGDQSTFWRTALVSGSAVDNFDTLVAEDSSRLQEEVGLYPLGSNFFALAGRLSTQGLIGTNDTEQLSALSVLADLDYPSNQVGTILPEQPCVIWGENGDNGVVRIILSDDTYYQDEYAAAGRVTVYEGDLELYGWQYPIRNEYAASGFQAAWAVYSNVILQPGSVL